MAGQVEAAAEKLRAYLRELKPGARALLIGELERGLLHGTSPAGAELVLSELRRSLREGQSKSARFGDPARLFFQPLEPFLVDDAPDHKHRGRIARSALEPLWLWVSNILMPEETKAYGAHVEHALVAGATDSADEQARGFQDLAAARVTEMLEGADDKERLAALGAQLPGHITSLAGPVLESVKVQLDSAAVVKSDLFLYSLVLVMSKLAAPWQLLRLATRAASSDTAKRIAETPYAVAVEIVLEEVDRRVRELATDLKSGRGIAVSALLKEVHDALRGLRSELDLSPESAWGKQLSTLRADVSRILSAEIELMPGRVRRLIRPRPSKEIVADSELDADEVTETEALIGFVATCRNYASELAINEVTQRTFSELQQFLESGTRTLLDTLRGASGGDRVFRQSQVDAAVRFCAKVFGQEYASLLAKAAEVASQDHEHKVATRA
jgi:hypothetical protein